MAIGSIVVGVDGSQSGFDALSFVLGLAAREGAYVNACFVARCVVVPALVETIAWDTRQLASTLEQSVNHELERSAVAGSFVVREGEVAAGLRRYAEECAADLIVVGRSRHPRLHVGSVPHRLVDAGEVPVLVVP